MEELTKAGLILVWILFGALAYGQHMGWWRERHYNVLGVGVTCLILSDIVFFLGPAGLVLVVLLNRRWYRPWWQLTPRLPGEPEFHKYYSVWS